MLAGGDSISGDIGYGNRILFPSSCMPSKDKYIQWAEALPLSGNKSVALLGPFDFEPCSEHNRVRRRVPRSKWMQLQELCKPFGIMPPAIGKSSANKLPYTKHHKKGNMVFDGRG